MTSLAGVKQTYIFFIYTGASVPRISSVNKFQFSLISRKLYNLHFIYLFGVLRCFQHCTGHITTGSWKGGGNRYIQLVKVLYYKLPTNGKQLPAFPLEVRPGTEPRSQRWEAKVLPLGPCITYKYVLYITRLVFLEPLHSILSYLMIT